MDVIDTLRAAGADALAISDDGRSVLQAAREGYALGLHRGTDDALERVQAWAGLRRREASAATDLV